MIKKIAHLLVNLVLVFLVGLAAAVAIVPRVTGSVPLTVLSGSMTPTFQPGDLIVVRPTPVEYLNIGDVVTFQPESGVATFITHRIVGITHDETGAVLNIQTQGDANNAADAPLQPAQIMGRVWYSVPMVGHVSNGRNAILAVSALGIVLVGYAVTMFLKKDDDEASSVDVPSVEPVETTAGTRFHVNNLAGELIEELPSVEEPSLDGVSKPRLANDLEQLEEVADYEVAA